METRQDYRRISGRIIGVVVALAALLALTAGALHFAGAGAASRPAIPHAPVPAATTSQHYVEPDAADR